MSRAAPIGRVWTRVLGIVHAVGAATTADVALTLRPHHDRSPPSRVDVAYAWTMLDRMGRRGYVRCRNAGDEMRVQRWEVAGAGAVVIAEMAAPRRRVYKTDFRVRRNAKGRRDRLRELKFCVNGETHGKATRGCRCDACHETHRRSA